MKKDSENQVVETPASVAEVPAKTRLVECLNIRKVLEHNVIPGENGLASVVAKVMLSFDGKATYGKVLVENKNADAVALMDKVLTREEAR